MKRKVFIFLVLFVLVLPSSSIFGSSDTEALKLKLQKKAEQAEAMRVRREEAAKAKRLAAQEARRASFEKKKARLDEIIDQVDLPADTSKQMTVKEVRISGNNLIKTETLLRRVPLIYNASKKSLTEAESEALYDLRGLVEVILTPGTSGQVSARTIRGFTQYLVSVYQKKNYAGIYIHVPKIAMTAEGTLVGDVLEIEVLEALVSSIRVRFYDPNQNEVEDGYLDPNLVLEWSPVKEGKVVNQKKLDNYVNLLNLNPDRYVSAVVSSGEEAETLSVGYDVYEANPWHWFIQVDNSGTRDRQWVPRLGMINTNLLGFDDKLGVVYQAPPESDWDEDYSLYGSYDFPVFCQNLRLNLFGGYSEFDVNPSGSEIDFLGNGDFYGAGLRLNVLQAEGWFFDVTGSISHERSRVTPSLFPDFLGTDLQWWLWSWGVELHHSDDISSSSIGYTRSASLGGESSGTEFNTARAGAKSLFTIHNFRVSHSQYIDADKVHQAKGTFRYIDSSERLVPSKMTVFGGMYTVRGYEEYEVVADGGVLASFQYEYDLIKADQARRKKNQEPEPFRDKSSELYLKRLAPVAFFDYGRARIKDSDTVSTENSHTEMYSVGVGLVTEVGQHFTGVIYYGFPLKKTADTDKCEGRINLGLMLRF